MVQREDIQLRVVYVFNPICILTLPAVKTSTQFSGRAPRTPVQRPAPPGARCVSAPAPPVPLTSDLTMRRIPPRAGERAGLLGGRSAPLAPAGRLKPNHATAQPAAKVCWGLTGAPSQPARGTPRVRGPADPAGAGAQRRDAAPCTGESAIGGRAA